LPVSIEDNDRIKNGLFQSEIIEVDFSNAVRSGKATHWYDGEYTVTQNVELVEIEYKSDE
jgi:hypothetical protein